MADQATKEVGLGLQAMRLSARRLAGHRALDFTQLKRKPAALAK